MIEPIVLVYTFVVPDRFADRIGEVAALVRRMDRETNQGELAFEINGEFFTTKVFD